MKKALFLACLLPTLAIGAEPRFEIPDGAYTTQARCSIEQSTRTLRNNGWTDWLNEKTSESFRFISWNTLDSLIKIEDRGDRVTHTSTTEISESLDKIERLEKVEEWTLADRKWKLETYSVAIAIHLRRSGPNLLLEKREDGRVFQWEVSTWDSHVTRNLLNPEILNTKERQVGLLRTVCRR